MCDDKDDLHVLVCIVAFAVEHRRRVHRLGYNAVAYLLVLPSEDDELHILSGAVDEHIDDVRVDGKGNVAEHHHPPVVEERPARANDDEVKVKQHAAERNVVLLVDKSCYDVPSARTAAGKEDSSDAETVEDGTQHASHRVLSRTEYL